MLRKALLSGGGAKSQARAVGSLLFAAARGVFERGGEVPAQQALN